MSTETKGHTIDLVPSERRIRVEVGGELVAESDRALSVGAHRDAQQDAERHQ